MKKKKSLVQVKKSPKPLPKVKVSASETAPQCEAPAPEPSVVLPPLPPRSTQLQAMPYFAIAAQPRFVLSAAAIVLFLAVSLGANGVLWMQCRSIVNSLNALASQYQSQLPVEISAHALSGGLEAYQGKRVHVESLALVSNKTNIGVMATRPPNSKGPSVDVYYENARNSPHIRAMLPTAKRTVSVTGTCNRYENENAWYIEAETVQ